MSVSNLLSTNAFLVAYALHEKVGTGTSAEALSFDQLKNMKALAGMLPVVLAAAVTELAEQKLVEITKAAKDNGGFERIATVRATRALLAYVDGFEL